LNYDNSMPFCIHDLLRQGVLLLQNYWCSSRRNILKSIFDGILILPETRPMGVYIKII
jgi:hypothetical protein